MKMEEELSINFVGTGRGINSLDELNIGELIETLSREAGIVIDRNKSTKTLEYRLEIGGACEAKLPIAANIVGFPTRVKAYDLEVKRASLSDEFSIRVEYVYATLGNARTTRGSQNHLTFKFKFKGTYEQGRRIEDVKTVLNGLYCPITRAMRENPMVLKAVPVTTPQESTSE